MPSVKITPITGEIYHVFNRGVDKRDIFLDRHDYIRFYQSLDYFNSVKATQNFKYAKLQIEEDTKIERLVEIQAYALLNNHYHLIIKQLTEHGVGEFLRRVSSGYTSYFNEKNLRTGSLFQGTYKRVHIASQEQFQYLFAYVNENQSVHGIKGSRELYQTSSLHYQGKHKSRLIPKENKGYYPYNENIELAQSIFMKRKSMKDLLE